MGLFTAAESLAGLDLGSRRRQGGGTAPGPSRFRAGPRRVGTAGARGGGRRIHPGPGLGGGGHPRGLYPEPNPGQKGGHLRFGALGDRQEAQAAGREPAGAGRIHPVGGPAGHPLRSVGRPSGLPGPGKRLRRGRHRSPAGGRPEGEGFEPSGGHRSGRPLSPDPGRGRLCLAERLRGQLSPGPLGHGGPAPYRRRRDQPGGDPGRRSAVHPRPVGRRQPVDRPAAEGAPGSGSRRPSR